MGDWGLGRALNYVNYLLLSHPLIHLINFSNILIILLPSPPPLLFNVSFPLSFQHASSKNAVLFKLTFRIINNKYKVFILYIITYKHFDCFYFIVIDFVIHSVTITNTLYF